jgi:hypothetical protein
LQAEQNLPGIPFADTSPVPEAERQMGFSGATVCDALCAFADGSEALPSASSPHARRAAAPSRRLLLPLSMQLAMPGVCKADARLAATR